MKQQHCWTTSELEELSKFLTVIINGQKAYGKEYSVRDVYEYFKLKLNGRFSQAQVMFALNEYTDKNNDIPSPADIIKILNPAKPEISKAEYIAAKEWQKRNERYDAYTDAYDVIKAFEAQEKEGREQFAIQNENIKSLLKQSVKYIGVRND